MKKSQFSDVESANAVDKPLAHFRVGAQRLADHGPDLSPARDGDVRTVANVCERGSGVRRSVGLDPPALISAWQRQSHYPAIHSISSFHFISTRWRKG